MNVLHVCASPKPITESVSKQMAAALVTKLMELNPDVDVTNNDLYNHPPPYLSYEAYRCFWQQMYERGYQPTEEERKAGEYGLSQCDQLKNADVLVLTMPLWNFGMPSIMKAWFDQIIIPSQLFEYTPEGARPLHKVRKAILLITSGEKLKEGDASDALTPQVEAILNYLGITDIALAWADGQDPILYADCEERKALAMEAVEELAEEIAEMI